MTLATCTCVLLLHATLFLAVYAGMRDDARRDIESELESDLWGRSGRLGLPLVQARTALIWPQAMHDVFLVVAPLACWLASQKVAVNGWLHGGIAI